MMLDFAKNVQAAQAGRTHVFSVGQAGFIIKSATGQLLAIDLYLSECVERVEGHEGFKRLLPQIMSPAELKFDVVICTHPHLDHFDMDAVPAMMGGATKLFCSVDCEKLVHQLQLEYYRDRITYVRPKDRYQVGDFDIAFVNCNHGAGAPDAVGVVVKVDGKTIYEAGDTCLQIEEFDTLPRQADVMIAPINGAFGNLNEAECIALAEKLEPKLTIPCHYGMFASHHGDVGRFYELMSEKKLPFLIMRQGEQYTL